MPTVQLVTGKTRTLGTAMGQSEQGEAAGKRERQTERQGCVLHLSPAGFSTPPPVPERPKVAFQRTKLISGVARRLQ